MGDSILGRATKQIRYFCKGDSILQRKYDNLVHTYCAQLLHLLLLFAFVTILDFLCSLGWSCICAQLGWRLQLHTSGGKGNPNSSCSQGVELLQGAELWEFTSCSLIFFLAILFASLATQFICAIRIQFCRSSLIFCSVFVSLWIYIFVFVYLYFICVFVYLNNFQSTFQNVYKLPVQKWTQANRFS